MYYSIAQLLVCASVLFPLVGASAARVLEQTTLRPVVAGRTMGDGREYGGRGD